MASLRSRSLPAAHSIVTEDDTAMAHFIDAMASAFCATEPTRSFGAELDGISYPRQVPDVDRAKVHRYIDSSVRDAVREGAILVEAGNMSAVAMWESYQHQHKESSNVHMDDAPLRQEWIDKVNSAKRRHIGATKQGSRPSTQLRPHYNLEFVGRNPDVPRVDGAVSAVILPFLERARQDRMVVWLEATSPYSASVYKHFGFRVVEEIVIGATKVNGDGPTSNNVPGIRAWAMVYNDR